MELRTAIRAFLRDLEFSGKSKKTLEAYYFHLEKFLSFCEERVLDYRAINGRASKEFRDYLAEKKLKPASINAILSAVKSFYDYLLDEELVERNPFISKRLRVKEPKRKPAFLSEGELEKVNTALRGLPYHIELGFKTMLLTGLRVGEVASLTGEDVIKEDNKVFLRVRSGKGQKERLVPVIDRDLGLSLISLSQKKGKDRLFGVSEHAFKFYAYKIKRETGVDFYCHRLRHTFATKLVNQGVEIDVVQEILGHTSINTTRKYVKTMPEKVKRLAVDVYGVPEKSSSFEKEETKERPKHLLWIKRIPIRR